MVLFRGVVSVQRGGLEFGSFFRSYIGGGWGLCISILHVKRIYIDIDI